MTSLICAKEAAELDSATTDFLKLFSKIFDSIGRLPLAEQRATIQEMFRVPEHLFEPIAMTEDKVILGRNGPINLRMYYPKNEGLLPVIVYFHRGGWVYGSIEESETICRRISNETGAIVAAVEYRLAPEHKFPIPLEDCYDAAQWIVQNAASFKVRGNPNKIILCGESAGGNLAAGVALMARDKHAFTVAGQLLIYPIVTSHLEKKSFDESPDKTLLSLENMQFFLNAYLSAADEGDNPYVSPLKTENFAKLPSSFILTAEYDALKHQGKQYGENLKQAGVSVHSKCYSGVIHGFLDLPLSDGSKKEAIQDIGKWVKSL